MTPFDYSDDEECTESYLVPVNIYNITDRIILANKELSEILPEQPRAKNEKQKQVTFRTELVDYEPEDDDFIEDEDENSILSDINDETNDCQEILDKITDVENSLVNENSHQLSDSNLIEVATEVSNEQIMDRQENIVEEIPDELEHSEQITEGEEEEEVGVSDPELKTKIDNICETTSTLILDGNKIETDVSVESEEFVTSFEEFTHEEEEHALNVPNRILIERQDDRIPSGKNIPETIPVRNKNKPIYQKYLKIQLNSRPCCEYKYHATSRSQHSLKLPRYAGYISEYGLSKDQLDAKVRKQQVALRRKHETNSAKMENASQKSQLNEEAFARWLKNKTKSNVTSVKTKNMYDFKKTNKK